MSRISRRHAPFIPFLSAIVLLTLIAIGSPVHAATVTVTNCKDAGPGSLRAAVASAASGDTVDLRARHCTILLTSGEIIAPQTDLRLLGSGATALTITSNYQSRVLNHSGTGTLRVERLSMIESAAFAPEFAYAGCIRSSGSVELHHARLHRCTAYGVPDPDCDVAVCSDSSSGAIAARGDVLLSYSTISDSSVSGYYSDSGGVSSGGRLTLYRSRLLRNIADIASAAVASEGLTAVESLIADNEGYDGGAVYVGDPLGSARAPADIRNSTFTGNRSEEGDCSALCAGHSSITNSTFSRNSARYAPAISSTEGSRVSNSTIVFNDGCNGAISVYRTLQLDSTIIAGNTCAGAALDLEYDGTVIGSHNLVMASSSTLPADTLRSNPRLVPLSQNGGFTPTYALADKSPAINRGSNVLGLRYDQRGAGFPRVKGGCADIGAFER